VRVAGEAYGATVAKRRLAHALLDWRKRTGDTANQVCDRLTWGRGKVGRFEANQWVRPEMSDVRDLLRHYRVPAEDAAELESWAQLARQRAWWREYGDVFDSVEFPGFEADAARISVYMPLVLPGLVQTPDYIDAHMSAGSREPGWRERSREARLRRQRILDRDDGTAPELHAVITEASLRYRWGTRSARRAQISHLAQLAHRPGVDLRLLRFIDGPHPGMSSLINIFEFPDERDQTMVFLENDVSIQEAPAQDVTAYVDIFRSISSVALDPDGTREYLDRMAKNAD
jgi:hypothetical protein